MVDAFWFFDPVQIPARPSEALSAHAAVRAVRRRAVGWDRGADRTSNDADVPSIPLSFRTASFPRYGWKAGLSDPFQINDVSVAFAAVANGGFAG
jgi:hypothetical protein